MSKKYLISRVCALKMVEQQAFAGKGLDYVTDVYLPERLGVWVV
ncbi:MAG: hypothetical protein WAW23_09605 [Candidatus Methanoperedens sp.]